MGQSQYIDKFYTITKHMSDVFDKTSRQMGYKAKDKNEHDKWKDAVRKKISEISGLDLMEKCSLEPQVIESIQFDEYRRDKIIIQTEPDVWMPVYCLIPNSINKDKTSRKHPVFIVPHGHGGGKFLAAGAIDILPVKNMYDKFFANKPFFSLQLVREGFIVFCPDARGAGERREWMKQSDQNFHEDPHNALNNMAISLGYSLAGMMTWDLMRLLDFIETREDCDPERIGCGGISGGGMQTIWLSAMDERIKCAVTSGYFYGFKESFLELPHNCACNFVPNLWKYVDMGDMGALIAPRPLLIESGKKDRLNGKSGIENVIPQVEITRQAYKLLGAEDRIYHHIHEGGHEWNGEKTMDFIKKWLL